MEKLLKSFAALENEWMNLRESTIRNLQSLGGAQGGSSEHALTAPAGLRLPQGLGVNIDPGLESTEIAYAECLGANDQFSFLLEEMREVVELGQECVRSAWVAEEKLHVSQTFSVVLDRGRSGVATSPVDTAHALSLKLDCYQADSVMLSAVLKMDRATGDPEENTLGAQIIILTSAPCLDLQTIKNVNYHLSLDKYVRLIEQGSSTTS